MATERLRLELRPGVPDPTGWITVDHLAAVKFAWWSRLNFHAWHPWRLLQFNWNLSILLESNDWIQIKKFNLYRLISFQLYRRGRSCSSCCIYKFDPRSFLGLIDCVGCRCARLSSPCDANAIASRFPKECLIHQTMSGKSLIWTDSQAV